MSETIVLGIDCGGTHTDAALLAVEGTAARLLASAKTITDHADLPGSILRVRAGLEKACDDRAKAALARISRLTLGTTLCINAILQGRADKVGLALSAGPGLDPVHFGLGEYVCVVPGGLDHRGVEVSRLFTNELALEAKKWAREGIAQIACVGKFSPRNPVHEQEMARVAEEASGLPASMGHSLSGRLNFPRRVATAYYNAAVSNLHNAFLDSVENSAAFAGHTENMRLLKADGGATSFGESRKNPVQSILSGPSASVMGALAQWPDGGSGCCLLLDMGGTTTDIAIAVDGSPVLERQGMMLEGRRTLVRALAQQSIAVGGDSLLRLENGADGPNVLVGPQRIGSAMAFGGNEPTLLDAFNVLNAAQNPQNCLGDVEASRRGLEKQAAGQIGAGDLAEKAVESAMARIARAAYDLVETVNESPIYTLARLRAVKEARPDKACLVGGPALAARARLEKALDLPLSIPPRPEVANAIGAALSLPTASLEIYADTGKGTLWVPALGFRENIGRNFTIEDAKKRALTLLAEYLEKNGAADASVEVVEADFFATLDDRGYGAKDIRVVAQARPGLCATVAFS